MPEDTAQQRAAAPLVARSVPEISGPLRSVRWATTATFSGESVTACCDRACLMKGGKVIALGEPNVVVDQVSLDESEEMDRTKGEAQGVGL